MKKQTSAFHRFLGLVEKELEASLAVLVVLGAIFGYSLASTELVAGDIQIAETTSNHFVINGREYSALNFATQSISGTYRVRATATNTTPSDVSQAMGGITGQTAGATYTFIQPLATPFTGMVYVWGNYSNNIQVGDTSVSNSQSAIALTNADVIAVTFTGGDVISRISLTSGTTSTAVAPKVSALNVLPSISTVAVGGSYTFIALPRNTAGAAIDNAVVQWSVSDISLATIDLSTGKLTAVAVGQVVVKAQTDGATASATVTIVPAVTTIPTKTVTIPSITTPSTDTTVSEYPGAGESTTYPGAPEDGTLVDTVADALTAPSTDGSVTETRTMIAEALDAFAEAQTKQITETGSTFVHQAVVNQIIAETATTTTQKLAIRVSLNWAQFKNDFQAMFSPASKTNVVKTVADFLSGLIIVSKGADASTGVMETGFGGDALE